MDKKKEALGIYTVPVSDEFQVQSENSFLATTKPPVGGGDNPGEEQGGDD